MKWSLLLSLCFLSFSAFAANSKSCAGVGEYDWNVPCCPGLTEVRVSNDAYVCQRTPESTPTCAGAGEYDWNLPCCAGLKEVRIGNDAYVCQ